MSGTFQSPFGETDSVRNLRAAHEAVVTERGRKIAVDAEELPVEEAAPLLRTFLEPFFKNKVGATALGRYYTTLAAARRWPRTSMRARRHPLFALRARQAV